MKPEILLWDDKDPEFTLDPILHSEAVQLLPRIVQYPRSTYNVSAVDDIQFDEAPIDLSVVVARERRVKLVSGNSVCDLGVKVYNEAMGLLASSDINDDLAKAYAKKHGLSIAVIHVGSDNNGDFGDYSGINGLIHVWQKPYIDADFGFNTILSKDPLRQAELESILEVLGLNRDVMAENESNASQGGQYEDSELAKLNLLLRYLAETDTETLSVEDILVM